MIDQMRVEIEEQHRQVQIEDLNHLYDIDSFNQAIRTNSLIEIPSSWRNINPEVKTVLMD